MSQESHLPILTAMFPGKILLSIEDIARLLNLSKGHIYNLSSADKLPFNLYKEKGLSDKVQVSIIEMARYLDKKLEPVKAEEREETPVPSLIKKRGRPRGSVSKRQASFQSQLSLAIVQHEVEEELQEIMVGLEALQYQDNELPCAEKMEDWKLKFSQSVNTARISLRRSIMELRLSNNKPEKKRVKKV